MKTWRYTLPGVPMSLNAMLSPGRGRFERVREQAELWAGEVLVEVSRRGRPRLPLRRARVELEYWFPDRKRRDPDNYCGKHITDGLRLAGVLEDDSFEQVELVIRQGGVDPSRPRVEVTVTDLEGGERGAKGSGCAQGRGPVGGRGQGRGAGSRPGADQG